MKRSYVYAFLLVCILVVAAFGILQTYSLQQTQYDLSTSRAQLKENANTIEQLQEKVNTIAQLQLSLNSSTQGLNELNQEVESLNEQISSLTTSMDGLQAQLNASQETIQSQAVTMSDQTSQIANLQNQITGLNDQVSSLQSQLLNSILATWGGNSSLFLSVTGLVQHPLNLTFYDLIAMPWTTVNAALRCVGSPDTVIAEGNWTGVKLASILQRANVTATAIKIALYAPDGYSTDLSLATGMRNDIIVAFEKDGVPLTEGLRLVAPGLWGYKWIASLSNINLVDYNFLGSWERMGYPDSGLYT